MSGGATAGPRPGPPSGAPFGPPATPGPAGSGASRDELDSRDPGPREFGRDGVSGLVTLARATRAREVSRPRPEDERAAELVLDQLLARADGRSRSPGRRDRPAEHRGG